MQCLRSALIKEVKLQMWRKRNVGFCNGLQGNQTFKPLLKNE